MNRFLYITGCLFALFMLHAEAAQSEAGGKQSARTAVPVQLAHTYSGQADVQNNIQNYLVSEKLDGIRARWNGAQLLTRNGNVIHAPDWFTEGWPPQIMDGELWTKRGDFENIASIVLSDSPDNRWREVTMSVFDLPAHGGQFAERAEAMKALVADSASSTLSMIPQMSFTSRSQLEKYIDEVVAAGGEGVMLHHRLARYASGRSQHLLKIKRYEDAEARVIRHLPGKGKFAGMMGSLLVETESGKRFKIGSGFSDEERLHPPPAGSYITFKYYGLTKRGKPRFASFLHRRPEKDRPQ